MPWGLQSGLEYFERALRAPNLARSPPQDDARCSWETHHGPPLGHPAPMGIWMVDINLQACKILLAQPSGHACTPRAVKGRGETQVTNFPQRPESLEEKAKRPGGST